MKVRRNDSELRKTQMPRFLFRFVFAHLIPRREPPSPFPAVNSVSAVLFAGWQKELVTGC